MRYLLAIVIAMVWGAGSWTTPAGAEDWPQWRGPNRDGVSAETGLLKQWPDGGPALVWQVNNIGTGYGSPAVVDERIYIISNDGLDAEMVKALKVADGTEIWSTRIGKVGNPDQRPNYPAARSTPTVVGDVLYALGSDGDLVCLATESGELRWQENVRESYGGKPGEWAYSESPLVDGDLVVVAPGSADAAVVALNRHTGQLKWKAAVPGNEDAGYASTIVVQAGDVKQYVVYLGMGLVGIEAETGKLLWTYDKTKGIANMATPVAADGLVYSGTGRTGSALVRLVADQGDVKAEQVYFSTKLPNAIGGAVLVDGHLYGTTGQVLMCVDFESGDVKWQDRSIAPASICYAEGRLYLHGEDGDVALVEATPEGFHQLGRFTPPDRPEPGHAREKSWAYPVVANGRLYIRENATLWSYDIKE